MQFHNTIYDGVLVKKTGKRQIAWGLITCALFVIALILVVVGYDILVNKEIIAAISDARIIYSAAIQQGYRTIAKTNAFSNSYEYVCSLLNTNINCKRCAYWCFVISVPDEINDNFPIMFTSNINPAHLPIAWDGMTDSEKTIPTWKSSAKFFPPLLNVKVVIIIRKSGAIEVIRSSNLTLKSMYNKSPFSLGEEVEYLTPTGRIKIRLNNNQVKKE